MRRSPAHQSCSRHDEQRPRPTLRRDLFVQEIVADDLPVICLVSPDILVGARNRIGNFRPAILDPYALWNVEELYAR